MATTTQYLEFSGSDKRVSRLVQGTGSLPRDDKDASLVLLDGLFALGSTAFDMAHAYARGDSEIDLYMLHMK